MNGFANRRRQADVVAATGWYILNHWLAFCLACCCGAVMAARGENSLAEDEPAKVLADAGLVKSGGQYLVQAEINLRTRLTEVKKLEKAFADAQKKMKEALAANAAIMTQIDQAKKEIEQIDQRLPMLTNLAQVNQLQQLKNQRVEFIRNSQGKVYDAQTRSENPPLRTAIADFGNAQAALGLMILQILEARSQLPAAYDKLKEDERVTAALAALNARLGPARNYESEFKRLDKLLAQVLTDQVPVYMSNFRFRLIGVLCEKTPTTFTYATETDFNTLTASAVEAAGLKIPADAPQGVIMAGERKIPFRQFKVPTLRLGRHVFRDVAVLVMGPEGEDLGSMLGSKFFEDCNVNFLPQELKFELQPNRTEQPAPTGDK